MWLKEATLIATAMSPSVKPDANITGTVMPVLENV
jgi:hypothetical protein